MSIQVSKIAELTGHAMGVYCLDRGNKPETVFSGSGDRFVAEWNLKALQPEKFSVKLEQSVYSIRHLTDEGLLLVGTSGGNLHVIDLQDRAELKNLIIHTKAIFDILYHKNNKHVYTLGGDGKLCVWDISDWRLLLELPLCDAKLRRGALSPDGSQLAVACGDGTVRIFETTFYNEVHTIQAHQDGANSVAWHPSKPVLISGGKDAWLRFWNTKDEFALVREIPAHNFAIYSIVFSPDGRFCATAGRDKTVKIWDASSFDDPVRIDRRSHRAHINSVNCLYWSEFDSILVSTGDDRTIQLWEISVTPV